MTMSFYHAAIIYSTKMYYKIHKIYTIFIVIPLALPPLMLPTALLLWIFLKRQMNFYRLRNAPLSATKLMTSRKSTTPSRMFTVGSAVYIHYITFTSGFFSPKFSINTALISSRLLPLLSAFLIVLYALKSVDGAISELK